MSAGIIAGLFALAISFTVFGAVLTAIDAAYTALSRSDLEELGDEYPAKQDQLATITKKLEEHMLAMSFVRVTSETFAAVLITVAFGIIFNNVWITLLIAAAAIAMLNVLVIGVSPWKIGARNPERIIRRSVGLVRSLAIILSPITPLLGTIGTRAFTAEEARDERLKNEQIFSLVDRAAEQDLLEQDEQDIIHSVVEFSDTLVKEVMVPRTDMVTVESTATVKEALEAMLSSRYSRVPVISGDSDAVVGVIYLRDVSSYVHRRPDEADDSSVTRIMKQAQFVPDLQRTDDLLRFMQQNANHLALAVDEYGGIAGLVTMEDLIEELVGEIHDEHDRELPDVIPQPDGSYLINARLSIEELGELFDDELDDDDVETVGGIVAKQLGRLAEIDDTVVFEGIELKVVEVEKKRQRLVTVVGRRVVSHTDPDKMEHRDIQSQPQKSKEKNDDDE